MPGPMLQRLALALCATVHVARAAVDASNSTTGNTPSYGGHLWLQDDNGANISELVPLSVQATTTNIEGTLFLTTEQTVANLTDTDIPLISCDSRPGHLQAQDIFQRAYQAHEINGVVFYSTTSLHCVYTGITDMMQSFAIYSMNSTTDSARVVKQLEESSSPRFPVRVVRSAPSAADSSVNGTMTNPNQNPLGPSPSTAVAMIILYSITGIITALFLVIIVTGAVRAHRHPDRYGPRDVLGRPRQSRARGIGRAILDTIPIVKFGQNEPPKPTDVELGSTSEVRDANATGTEPTAHGAQTTVQTNAATTETPRDATSGQHETMASGISEAQPAAAGVAASHSDDPDDSLVCSICTEEFEQGQDTRVLPCNHKFHPDCVDPWLLNVSGTCPLCRVDLRPVTTNDSSDSNRTDPNHLAPPLQSSNDLSHRRRTLMRDILSFRTRPDASADERISALRRLREQRRNRSEEGVSASASDENVATQRRSRLSARLSGVFHGRRRRDDASAEREDTAQAPAAAPAAGSSSASTSGPSSEPAASAPEREQR